MSSDPTTKLRAARRRWERARPAWYEAIREALSEGMTITEVAEVAGYNREQVRRIRDGKQT